MKIEHMTVEQAVQEYCQLLTECSEKVWAVKCDLNVRDHFATKGKKYYRIVEASRVSPETRQSVHAFVGIDDGYLYKADGWSRPSKGVRYNLMDDVSKHRLFQGLRRMADAGSSPSGSGYLYRR